MSLKNFKNILLFLRLKKCQDAQLKKKLKQGRKGCHCKREKRPTHIGEGMSPIDLIINFKKNEG
jgi:hypothetical protein